MIKIIDNFLSTFDYNEIVSYCKTSDYYYGETDDGDTPCTGMTSEINLCSDLSLLFHTKLIDHRNDFKHLNMYRMYLNCFSPNENPYFHIDGDSGITCLYYPTENWTYNEGGETQFIINDEIKGILPIPNRMVIFNANILHRATSFRNKHRFTIAIKYS
jgi:hypothetical protein